jgi:hypothetical protein
MARKLSSEKGKLKKSLSVLGRNKTWSTTGKSNHNYSAKTWLLKLK